MVYIKIGGWRTIIVIAIIATFLLPVLNVTASTTYTRTIEFSIGEKDVPWNGCCYAHIRMSFTFNENGTRNNADILTWGTYSNQGHWQINRYYGGFSVSSTGLNGRQGWFVDICVELRTWYWFKWYDQGSYTYHWFVSLENGVVALWWNAEPANDNRLGQWTDNARLYIAAVDY